MSDGTKSQKHAVQYMNYFNDELNKCTNIEDYMSLVLGALLFTELVVLNFKTLNEDLSESELDEEINYMRSGAKQIALKVEKTANTQTKAKLN